METADVVIIGAGVAGLAAAQHLSRHGPPGLCIVVLEARSRLGGRAWSYAVDEPTSSDSGPHKSHLLDLGAAWVHGVSPDNPLLPLLRDAGATLLPVARRASDDACAANPWLFPRSDVFAWFAADNSSTLPRHIEQRDVDAGLDAWSALRAAAARAACSGRLDAYASGAAVLAAARSSDDELIALDATLASDAASVAASAVFLHCCWQGASSPSALSASEYESTVGLCGDFPGPHAAVPGLGAHLVSVLAPPPGVCLRLGAAVTGLDWSAAGVVGVTFTQGEDQQRTHSIAARHVICTVPLAVLYGSDCPVTFCPPLPPWKRAAAGSLGRADEGGSAMTRATTLAPAHYKKVIIKLSTDIKLLPGREVARPFLAFCPPHDASSSPNDHCPFFRLVECWGALKGPFYAGVYAGILCGDEVWACEEDKKEAVPGAASQEQRAWDAETCVAALLAQLGASREAVAWSVVTAWESDPLARAAYYHCGPGASDGAVDALAAPLLAGSGPLSDATAVLVEEGGGEEDGEAEDDSKEAEIARESRRRARLVAALASSSPSTSTPAPAAVHFAGDAFNARYLGSLHGALLSGRAAAGDVLAVLGASAPVIAAAGASI